MARFLIGRCRLAAPDDTFALARAESILLDGANSVSGQPRQGFPGASLSSGVAVVMLVAALVLLRRRRPRWLLAVLLLAAAVPGAVCVLTLRGDAPHRRGALAATLTTTLARVEQAAPWPGPPVQVVHEDDDVLFPLGRYALPARPPPSTPATQLELRGGVLDVACATAGERVVCGAAP
jgi:hypothetical protein